MAGLVSQSQNSIPQRNASLPTYGSLQSCRQAFAASENAFNRVLGNLAFLKSNQLSSIAQLFEKAVQWTFEGDHENARFIENFAEAMKVRLEIDDDAYSKESYLNQLSEQQKENLSTTLIPGEQLEIARNLHAGELVALKSKILKQMQDFSNAEYVFVKATRHFQITFLQFRKQLLAASKEFAAQSNDLEVNPAKFDLVKLAIKEKEMYRGLLTTNFVLPQDPNAPGRSDAILDWDELQYQTAKNLFSLSFSTKEPPSSLLADPTQRCTGIDHDSYSTTGYAPIEDSSESDDDQDSATLEIEPEESPKPDTDDVKSKPSPSLSPSAGPGSIKPDDPKSYDRDDDKSAASSLPVFAGPGAGSGITLSSVWASMARAPAAKKPKHHTSWHDKKGKIKDKSSPSVKTEEKPPVPKVKKELEMTGRMQKDLKAAQEKGWDFSKYHHVINSLLKGIPLPKENRNHRLSGVYEGAWDCHINGDWVLIYKISPTKLILLRTGTHSDLRLA